MNIKRLPRLKNLASQGGFAHFAIPLVVILAVAGIGGYLISQSHAATASNMQICDNDAANNATANRGAYCLDDLNEGSTAAIWTAKTAGATGCFKLASIGSVESTKPFNNATLSKFYANDTVVYIQSCGPKKGYLHPNGPGNTPVILSSSAGKAEEWVRHTDGNGGFLLINVPNTNAAGGTKVYGLMASGNVNGNKVTVSSSISGSQEYLAEWKTATYTLTSSSSSKSGSTTSNPGGSNKSSATSPAKSSSVASDLICDNNGATNSTANRGPYCLDDLNESGKAAIWTANTASATACFKVVQIGTVATLKPLNNTTLQQTFIHPTGADPVVYLESCGPDKGYLHPDGNGNTDVVLSKSAGKAEEWIMGYWLVNHSADFVSVPNTNGSPHGNYIYVLGVSGNKNGNNIKVYGGTGGNHSPTGSTVSFSNLWWKVITNYKP